MAKISEHTTQRDSRKRLTVAMAFAMAAGLVAAGVAWQAAVAAVSAGTVTRLVARAPGDVVARERDGTVRELERGDDVFAGDTIETGRRGLVQLELQDRSKFSLGPNSSMEVSDFAYGSAEREDTVATRILKGAFRFVSGLIARNRPASMRVRLGVIATIGLRGTNVGGEVGELGDSATVVLLDPEDPDQATAIDVSNDFGSVTIDEPGFGTEIPDANSPPSPPRRMRLRTIENLTRTLGSISRMSVPRPRPMHRN